MPMYKNFLNRVSIKPIVYFHIGMPKTGTSAIQGFLDINREILASEKQCLYPNFRDADFTKGNSLNHGPFFLQAKKSNDFSDLNRQFTEACLYCEKKGIPKMVISNEGFFWHWWPAFIKNLINITGVDYRIIIYLRRQDNFVAAGWKQWGHKISGINNIQEYAECTELDWHQVIQRWLKHFDQEKFIVKAYEKQQIGSDIVTDFISSIGIKNSDNFKKAPKTNGATNNGFSEDVVEIMKYSKELLKGENDNKLLDFMHMALSEQYRKQPMQDYDFLSPQERNAIIQKFEASNAKLSEIFFSGKKIFNDPLPQEDQKWEASKPLTLERAIPIFIDILLTQGKQIRELRSELDNLK